MAKNAIKAIVKPKDNGDSGRDRLGRFGPGNKPVSGRQNNPMAKMRARLQSALQAAVSEADIIEIVKVLIGKAKAGDVYASREILDRVVGKSEQPVTGDITVVIRTH